MFQYAFPHVAASKPEPKHDGKQGDKGKDDKGRDKGKEKPEGPVRTQMIGEKPGDDLGYDPATIPTEPID